MEKQTVGYKPTAAFDSVNHFEKHVTLKKCGFVKYISLCVPQFEYYILSVKFLIMSIRIGLFFLKWT